VFAEVGATRHHANLFAVFVGGTASGAKGTAWSAAKWLLRDADPVWSRECVQTGLSTGEGLIHAVRDPRYEPEKPGKGIKGSDPGRPNLVLADPGVIDKRLLVVETEMGTLFKRSARDTNTLSPVMRDAWDGHETLRTMVKADPNKATDAHVSMVGHITAEELRFELAKGTDIYNGFANRCLWFMVRRSKLLPDGGSLTAKHRDRFGRVLSQARETAPVLGCLARDDGARAMWGAVYAELSRERGGAFGKVTARAHAQALRLSMIYAAVDGSAIIRREHLDAALAVWRYCEASAAMLFKPGGDLPVEDTDRELLMLIRLQGGRMNTRDVMRSAHRATYNTADKVSEAFARMRAKGWGRVEYPARVPGQPGRDPSPVFVACDDGDRNPLPAPPGGDSVTGHLSPRRNVLAPPPTARGTP
jgi:hypothetical protein